MQFTIAALAALASTASAYCHHSTHLFSRATGTNYSYAGVEGPLNWHNLDSTYSTCGTGVQQSPIALDSSMAILGSEVFTFSGTSKEHETLENLGHTVQVMSPNASLTLTQSKNIYDLAQFHFHTPSEHHLDGLDTEMEMHMVFQQRNATDLAVLGVLINIATETNPASAFLESVFVNVDKAAEKGDQVETNKLDYTVISDLASDKIIQYHGSLTTPPCTEGIAWNVATERLYISQDTFNKVKKITKFNSRFIQNVPGEKNLLQLTCA